MDERTVRELQRSYNTRDDVIFDQRLKEVEQITSQIVEMRECYDLILKTARRCTRDLNHAIDQIPSDCPFIHMLRARVSHYGVVLGGTTDYRVSLYEEIDNLKRALKRETF